MVELTVKRLRSILENALDQLEDYDDKDIVSTVGNTYHLRGGTGKILQTSSGFVDLGDIEIEEQWDDEDEADESFSRRRVVDNRRFRR